MGRDHGHVWPEPAHFIQYRLFMGRIGIGVQQANRNRLYVVGAERFNDCGDLRQFKRLPLLTIGMQASGYFAAQIARYEGGWLYPFQVEVIRAIGTGDLQHIAKAVGGY